MREVGIFQNPVAEPGVCIKCGSQHREWFIDIGIDVDYNEDRDGLRLWLDGIAYLCSDCFNGLVKDVYRRFAEYEQTHDVEVQPYGYESPNERDDVPDEISSGTEPDDSESEQSSIEPKPVFSGFRGAGGS